MFSEERRSEILAKLNEEGRLLVKELAKKIQCFDRFDQT